MLLNLTELSIPGPAGTIELIWHGTAKNSAIAIICHPHPLFGGNMQNKVVTTLHKTFHKLGLATVRFNFRGVGKSTGKYAESIGEVADCFAVIKWIAQNWPTAELWLAGFSFGSYIAARVAHELTNTVIDGISNNLKHLISIAPPVHHSNFTELKINCPWLIIQGENDAIVPVEQVYAWYNQLQGQKSLIRFAQTDHFFHGRLTKLAEEVYQHYQELT